jgi:hypothetical protein
MRKSYGFIRRKPRSKDPEKPKEYASAGPGGAGKAPPKEPALPQNAPEGEQQVRERVLGKVCAACGYPDSMGHDPDCGWMRGDIVP